MTTLAAARTALVTAVGAKDDVADPPFTLVFSDGTDFSGATLKGQLVWRFRVMCVVALNSDNAAGDVLMNAYLATQIAALQAGGWQPVSVSPTTVTSLAGSDLLTADIAVSTYVTLS